MSFASRNIIRARVSVGTNSPSDLYASAVFNHFPWPYWTVRKKGRKSCPWCIVLYDGLSDFRWKFLFFFLKWAFLSVEISIGFEGTSRPGLYLSKRLVSGFFGEKMMIFSNIRRKYASRVNSKLFTTHNRGRQRIGSKTVHGYYRNASVLLLHPICRSSTIEIREVERNASNIVFDITTTVNYKLFTLLNTWYITHIIAPYRNCTREPLPPVKCTYGVSKHFR